MSYTRLYALIGLIAIAAALLEGCGHPTSVATQTVTRIDTSKAWTNGHFAVIPVGDSEDPEEWTSILDAYERQQGVHIISWNFTEQIYSTPKYKDKETTHGLLVTFERPK